MLPAAKVLSEVEACSVCERSPWQSFKQVDVITSPHIQYGHFIARMSFSVLDHVALKSKLRSSGYNCWKGEGTGMIVVIWEFISVLYLYRAENVNIFMKS